MEDKFTEKRFIIHNLVKFKSLLDCVGSLYQEKKISQGDEIFIIGNIKKHDDGSLTIESPIDPMLPFTISNEPNWRSGRGILISVLSLQFFSCISSAVLLFSIFYEFLKPIFPRTIRTLNFAPYVVKIDTNSSSFAVLANVEVKRPNHKLYYEEALTALKQNNIYDEKILPSYITENAKSVSFIYLYHKSRTTSTGYLVYLLRGLSVVLSAYAFLSLVDTISFHNRHFGKA